MSAITLSQSTLGELLSKSNLHIPDYQRPYKWGRQHIRNLFYDVKEAMSRDTYQIGSLILHEHDQGVAIVDGQQRLISVALFLHELGRLEHYTGALNLLCQEFSELSCHNAKENSLEWEELISLDRELANQICGFLLHRCQVSVITVPEDRLAEAFQLFDSQNNRGKSLEPHDLLKAYHLRHIDQPSEETIKTWEMIVNDSQLSLKHLFDRYLFRLRRWTAGETGLTRKRYGSYLRFTEAYVDDFKGVDLSQPYPYLNPYRLLSDFPKSLTMPLINGRVFFEYINYAHKVFSDLRVLDVISILDEDIQFYIRSSERQYSRNNNLFYNSLALFVDRFGVEEVNKAVLETLFVWAYYPRVKAKAIYDATLANYAAGGTFQNRPVQKLYQLLNRSITPSNFLQKINREQFEHLTARMVVEKLNGNKK